MENKPLSLHILKHHKHNPLRVAILCTIDTKELTLGTEVSAVAVNISWN